MTGARVTGDATLDGVDRKSSPMRCHLNKEGSEGAFRANGKVWPKCTYIRGGGGDVNI